MNVPVHVDNAGPLTADDGDTQERGMKCHALMAKVPVLQMEPIMVDR